MQITLNQSLPRALSLLRAPSCGVEARDGPVLGQLILAGKPLAGPWKYLGFIGLG